MSGAGPALTVARSFCLSGGGAKSAREQRAVEKPRALAGGRGCEAAGRGCEPRAGNQKRPGAGALTAEVKPGPLAAAGGGLSAGPEDWAPGRGVRGGGGLLPVAAGGAGWSRRRGRPSAHPGPRTADSRRLRAVGHGVCGADLQTLPQADSRVLWNRVERAAARRRPDCAPQTRLCPRCRQTRVPRGFQTPRPQTLGFVLRAGRSRA